MTNIDDLQKIPINNRQNRPSSGAYGERVELERLEASLPDAPAAPSQGTEAGTPPPPLGGDPVTPVRSSREGTIPGIPAPILRPSDRPNEPVATPVQPPPTGAVTAQQRRLAVLDILANSSEVSEETREWAQMVMRVLTQ